MMTKSFASIAATALSANALAAASLSAFLFWANETLSVRAIIPKNKTIYDAGQINTPIALYDMKSFGSETYLRLAKEILR